MKQEFQDQRASSFRCKQFLLQADSRDLAALEIL